MKTSYRSPFLTEDENDAVRAAAGKDADAAVQWAERVRKDQTILQAVIDGEIRLSYRDGELQLTRLAPR